MNTAKKLMLLNLGGEGSSGAAAITYLFRDDFTTDEAAPLTSPRTADPGPGTLTIADSGNKWAIVSSVLQSQGANSVAQEPAIYDATGFARAAGLAFITRIKYDVAAGGVAQWANVGFVNAIPYGANIHLTRLCGFLLVGTTSEVNIANLGNLLYTPTGIVNNTYANLAIVMRTAGAFLFVDETLVWVFTTGTDATVYPAITTRGTTNAANATVDNMYGLQLSAPFTTDYGIATLNEASPADATAYTGDADGIIDLTVTAPGSLDGDPTTRCGFYYRADADLTPAWHCYVAGDGTFNLDSIASDGTRTNRITVAAVIVAGGTRTLRVITAATIHNAYSLSSTTWTKRGAEITLSLNDAVTRIIPSVPAGWSIANLRSYPRTSTGYDALDPN